MVDISPSLEGRIHIARENEMLSCPFAGQRDFAARLIATVNGESCTPPNARVPAQGYLLAVIPPGCQSRNSDPDGPEPWVEPHTFELSAALTPARGYPLLILNISETGQFHDPLGYYTGTYTGESNALLTHPEDPLVD